MGRITIEDLLALNAGGPEAERLVKKYGEALLDPFAEEQEPPPKKRRRRCGCRKKKRG